MSRRPTEHDLARAAAVLREGGLVAFPTETVYGLGANALDVTAVAKVFEAKGRPHFDPLIVHVADTDAARRLVTTFPATAAALAEAFWPGPLTLVLPKRTEAGGGGVAIPDLVTSGLPTVAVRVPAHPVARELIERAGVPVAAPSANRFGGVSPTTAEHVRDELAGAVDVILDGGPCRTGVESTVVSIVEGEPIVLRLGGVEVEALREVAGEVSVAQPGQQDEAGAGKMSPGMLERHYAPRTPLAVVDDLAAVEVAAGERVGLLAFREPAGREAAAVEVLSPTGDLREAAANLFAAMRRLDGAQLNRIVAQRVPDVGLGRAINDRLRRASVR